MLSFKVKPLSDKPKPLGEQAGLRGIRSGSFRKISMHPNEINDLAISQQRIVDRQKSIESVKNSIRGYTLQNTNIFRPKINTQKSRAMFNSQMSQKLGSQDSSMGRSSKGYGPTTMILATEKLSKDAETMRLEDKKKKINEVLEGKTEEEIFAKGLRHFRDAYLLRPPRNIFDRPNNTFGKHFLFFYELKWTYLWKSLQTILSYLFLLQTFLEPQTLADTFTDTNLEHYVYIQEIIILSFNLIDNILGLFLFKSAHKSNVLNFLVLISRFSLIIAFSVDFIIFWHTSLLGIRFSAMLRPLWLIQFQDEIYKTLKSIIWSFKQVIDIFLFFVFISIFWGYMGYNLFSEYSDQYADDKYFVFGSIGKSMIGMYTLISMDSYPSILKSIVLDNAYYLIFFLPFIAFNLFFLLFIPVAVIFDNYKNQRARLMLQDQIILHEGLIFSFYCISYSNEQEYISRDQFFNLIDKFYNGSGIRERIDNIYSLLNIDIQDKLSLGEFLDVHDLILSSERLDDNSTKFWRFLRTFCNRYLKFEKIGRSLQWNYFILIIVTINTTLVLVYTFLASSTSDGTSTFEQLMTNLDLVFNVIYIVDVCIKVIGFGVGNYFSDPWNNFDFFMVCISIVTIFGLNYIYFLKKAKSTKLFKLTKIQKVLKIFRSLRSLKLFKILKLGTDALLRVKKLFHKIVLCVPSLYGLLKTFFLFSFTYAVIGTYLFNTEYNDYNSGSPFDMNDFTSFNTLQGALLVLFQVVTQSRWVDYVYGYGYQFSLELSMFYFCFYHMFSILFFMSLLQGVIWEVFGVVEEYFRQHELEEMHLHHEQQLELENGQHEDEESCNNIDFQDASEEDNSNSANETKIAQETKIFLRTRGGIRQNVVADDAKSEINCTKEENTHISDQNLASESCMLADKVLQRQKSSKFKEENDNKRDRFQEKTLERTSFVFDGVIEEDEKSENSSQQRLSLKKQELELTSVEGEQSTQSKIKPFFKKNLVVQQNNKQPQEESEKQQEQIHKSPLEEEKGNTEKNKLTFSMHQGVQQNQIQNNRSPSSLKQFEVTSPQNMVFTSSEKLLQKEETLNLSSKVAKFPQIINKQLTPNYSPGQIEGDQHSANSLDKKTTESTRNNSISANNNAVNSPSIIPESTNNHESHKEQSKKTIESDQFIVVEKEYEGVLEHGIETEEQDRASNFLVLDSLSKGFFSKRSISLISDFESKSPQSKNLVSQYSLKKQEKQTQEQVTAPLSETKNDKQPQETIISFQDEVKTDKEDKELAKNKQVEQTKIDEKQNKSSQEDTSDKEQQQFIQPIKEETPQVVASSPTMPSVVKKIIGVLKQQDVIQSNQSSSKVVIQLNDVDKYLLKRAQVIKYQVDLIQQLNQLENFLQLHDQTCLVQGEKRKERIVQKHKGLNHFTISKQHALEKMTYLKDNPANINYGSRNTFLLATEIQLGYSQQPISLGNTGISHQKKTDNPHNNSQQTNNNQVHPEDNPEKNSSAIKNGRLALTPSEDKKFMIGDEQIKKVDSLNEIDEGNLSGSSGDHSQQDKYNQMVQHPGSKQVQLNDQTFLRLNNIFQFLLHLLTNVPVLDSYILIQKLYVIEQCINQVIFGDYDEGQPLNHFKFVFGQSTSDKYLVLVKQYEMYESQDFFDEKYAQHHQNQLQQQQIQNPAAHSAIEVKTLTGEGAPWASFMKAFKLEKTIYFIHSLFESSDRSPDDESIAQKLSTAMQFMRGYEFCLEDLTTMITELYTCFIQARTQSEEKPGNPSSTQIPFISFICNRWTGAVVPKKKKKNKSVPPVNGNPGKSSSINNGLESGNAKTRNSSEPPAQRIKKNLSKEKKSQDLETILKNNEENKQLLSKIYEAPVESEIVPNDQSIFQQTGLETIKHEPGEDHDSLSSPTLLGKLKRTKSPFGVGKKEKGKTDIKKSIEGEQIDSIIEAPRNIAVVEDLEISKQIIQPIKQPTQIKKLTLLAKMLTKNKARGDTFIRNKKTLEQKQEHIVKIYHQVQQFFATHSHLISGLVAKLSTQVTAHIPCYINSNEIDHKNLRAS